MPGSEGGADCVCNTRIGFEGGEIGVKLINGLVPKISCFSLRAAEDVIHRFRRLKALGAFVMRLMLPLF